MLPAELHRFRRAPIGKPPWALEIALESVFDLRRGAPARAAQASVQAILGAAV